MLIVPVLDLMRGHVVHARRGDRANYRPLQSRLTQASDPLGVIGALLALAPFHAVYIADLDAIRGDANHQPQLRAILAEYPLLEVWLDAAFAQPRQLEAWRAEPQLVPVIGSECLNDVDQLAALRACVPHAILSLDSKDGETLGPPRLVTEPGRWPERVIGMTLERVGAGAGPAFERLNQIQQLAPTKKVIAAGGVRHAADLSALAKQGVHAALVASALHGASLRREDLSPYLGGANGDV